MGMCSSARGVTLERDGTPCPFDHLCATGSGAGDGQIGISAGCSDGLETWGGLGRAQNILQDQKVVSGDLRTDQRYLDAYVGDGSRPCLHGHHRLMSLGLGLGDILPETALKDREALGPQWHVAGETLSSRSWSPQ